MILKKLSENIENIFKKERKKERENERRNKTIYIYIFIFFLSMSVLIFECLAICTEKQDKHIEQGFFCFQTFQPVFITLQKLLYTYSDIHKTNWHLYVCFPVISPSKH